MSIFYQMQICPHSQSWKCQMTLPSNMSHWRVQHKWPLGWFWDFKTFVFAVFIYLVSLFLQFSIKKKNSYHTLYPGGLKYNKKSLYKTITSQDSPLLLFVISSVLLPLMDRNEDKFAYWTYLISGWVPNVLHICVGTCELDKRCKQKKCQHTRRRGCVNYWFGWCWRCLWHRLTRRLALVMW